MQARRLPAERGAFWLTEGFRLFRRNPPLITALTLMYLLVVQSLAVLLPGVGPILLPLALPVLTLIVANGCRIVDEGRAPDKAELLKGLTGNGVPMLRLGGLQLAGAVLLLVASMALGGGADPFAQLEVPETAGSAPAPGGTPNMGEAESGGLPADPAAEAAMLGALLRLLLLAAPLIVAFWFAPFLVGWERVGPVKSLFFSTVASFRNWRAMLMFGLAVTFAAGIVPGFILIAVGQVAGMALSVALVVLRMLLIFIAAPVLTASIYVSYRDIFQPGVDESA